METSVNQSQPSNNEGQEQRKSKKQSTFSKTKLKRGEWLQNLKYVNAHPRISTRFLYNDIPTKHIKFMTAYVYYKNQRYYQFAVVTDSYEYFEFNLFTSGDPALYWNTVKQLNSMFSFFTIDRETVVVLDPKLKTRGNPIRMYLSILQSMIYFNLRYASIFDAVKRILFYYSTIIKSKRSPKTKYSNYHVERCWKALVEKDCCPWINSEVDSQIKLCTRTNQLRQKYLRLTLLYAVIKVKLSKSALKAKQKCLSANENNIDSEV